MTASILDLCAYRRTRAELPATAGTALFGFDQRVEGRGNAEKLIVRGEPRQVELRADKRNFVEGVLQLSVTIGGRPATLHNISRGGLMAQADVPLGAGASLLIRFKGCDDMFGRLVWKRGNMVGVEVPIGSMKLRSPR